MNTQEYITDNSIIPLEVIRVKDEDQLCKKGVRRYERTHVALIIKENPYSTAKKKILDKRTIQLLFTYIRKQEAFG